MKDIKNIIIVNDFDYIQGGASKVAIDTAKILHDNKYNVIFFSATHSDKYIEYGYKNISLNIPEALNDKNKIRGLVNGIYNFKVAKEFNKLLKTLNKDETIIHVHGWTKSLSSSIFRIAFKENFKVVLTLHDYFTMCPNGGFYNYKEDKICKLKGGSCKCCFKNCDSRNYLFKMYRNIRFFVQNKIVRVTKRINNVIYISDFSWNILKNNFNSNITAKLIYNPIKFHKSNDINMQQKKYYLYVGRVCKEKGTEMFCEAITKLKYDGIVVGQGPELDKLKEKYPNIDFVGWKSESDVKEYMKNAKALVMPSKCYEGAPLTNLEALSVNIPSLVSNACAASEISNEKNGTGFTFNNNLDSIMECIETFENKYNDKSFNNSILSKFSYDNYYKKIIDYYFEMVGDPNEKN